MSSAIAELRTMCADIEAEIFDGADSLGTDKEDTRVEFLAWCLGVIGGAASTIEAEAKRRGFTINAH